MSASLRNRRCWIYAHQTTSDGGYATDSYLRRSSSAPDFGWWASVATAAGRESALGGQAQQTADLTLGFERGVVIGPDDVVRLDHATTGRIVRVTSPALPRDHGVNEHHVTALYVDDAQAADFVLVTA